MDSANDQAQEKHGTPVNVVCYENIMLKEQPRLKQNNRKKMQQNVTSFVVFFSQLTWNRRIVRVGRSVAENFAKKK